MREPSSGPRHTKRIAPRRAARSSPPDTLSVAVDVVLLSAADDRLHTLVLRREEEPFLGAWALPGGFVGEEEDLESAAQRVLAAKADLRDVYLEQLFSFGAVRRDPRRRVLSVAYLALLDHDRFRSACQSSGTRLLAPRIVVPWEGETGGPVVLQEDGRDLVTAFDHAEIVGLAVKRVRGKLNYTPIGFQLLPERFTLRSLQVVHETVLGRPLNKDSFRRRMLASDQLEATGERQEDVDHRPAELYRFQRRSAV